MLLDNSKRTHTYGISILEWWGQHNWLHALLSRYQLTPANNKHTHTRNYKYLLAIYAMLHRRATLHKYKHKLICRLRSASRQSPTMLRYHMWQHRCSDMQLQALSLLVLCTLAYIHIKMLQQQFECLQFVWCGVARRGPPSLISGRLMSLVSIFTAPAAFTLQSTRRSSATVVDFVCNAHHTHALSHTHTRLRLDVAADILFCFGSPLQLQLHA